MKEKSRKGTHYSRLLAIFLIFFDGYQAVISNFWGRFFMFLIVWYSRIGFTLYVPLLCKYSLGSSFVLQGELRNRTHLGNFHYVWLWIELRVYIDHNKTKDNTSSCFDHFLTNVFLLWLVWIVLFQKCPFLATFVAFLKQKCLLFAIHWCIIAKCLSR